MKVGRNRSKSGLFTAGDDLDFAASHYVGVDIDRIDWVGDSGDVVCCENVADISGVALCPIADENFFRRNVNTARRKIIFSYRVAEKIITAVRPITHESFCVRHIVDRFVHGVDADLRQRAGNVADAERNHLFVRVSLFICVSALRCIGKKVTLL